MRSTRSRRSSAPVVALVLLLVLGAWLASAPASASAEDAEADVASEPEDGAFTTLLQPGWNMAAWLGPEAPVSAVFDAIPGLERVYAWHNEEERYRRAFPTSVTPDALRRVDPGMGLWLRVGGDSPVEWTRTPPERGVLLSLSAGWNLVGWGGGDGEPFAESIERFGDAVVEARRWNASTRRYERYRPGADDTANTLRELNRGDAFWINLNEDARWWQSGLVGTTFELGDELTEEEQAGLREDVTSVVTFFAERYGIEPPPFLVEYEPTLEIFAGARGGHILLGKAVPGYPLRAVTLAHEYFHVLQSHFAGSTRSPAWMTEGTATYAGGIYRRDNWRVSGEQLRNARWRHSADVTVPLDEIELRRLFYAGEAPVYSLAAIAVEWLEGRLAPGGLEAESAPLEVGWPDSFTDTAAYIEYYRLLPSAEEWEDAFAEAFGITVDDFYEAFEGYREALYATAAAVLPDE